jgi:hypothetical protein
MASKQTLLSDDTNSKMAVAGKIMHVASIEPVEKKLICGEALLDSRSASDEHDAIVEETLTDMNTTDGKDLLHVVIVGQVCDSRQGELVSTVIKTWSRLLKETSSDKYRNFCETNKSHVSVHIIKTLSTNRTALLDSLPPCDLMVLVYSEHDDKSFRSVCKLRQAIAEMGNTAPVVFVADKEDLPEVQSSEEPIRECRRPRVFTEDRKYVARKLKGLLKRIQKSACRNTLKGLELQNEVMAMLNIFSGFQL